MEGLAKLQEPTPALIRELSASGFEAVSISPELLLDLDDSIRLNLAAALADHGMGVALHGSFETSIGDLIDLAKLFGSRLENVTFDPLLG